MIRDIAQPKRDGIPFKDMPHGDAKRRPWKLNEREHCFYMTEAERNFNIVRISAMNRVCQHARLRTELAHEDCPLTCGLETRLRSI